jgi:hypothetical protein
MMEGGGGKLENAYRRKNLKYATDYDCDNRYLMYSTPELYF